MRKLTALFMLAFLPSCTYAISPAVMSQADKTITFEMLDADAEALKGRIVVLGGIIVRTVNTKQGALIEVEDKPLDYWGKPKRTDSTSGRFLVLHRGYLDDFVYAPGREITVAAEIEGTRRKAPDEEVAYQYPLVLSKELKLWDREPPPQYRPGWVDPLYNPSRPLQPE